MKTNKDKNHGGRLKEEYRGMWAEYLCRFLEGYRKKGVTVKRISIQNEPAAVQIWDSCVYSAGEEKEFLRDYLYPALCAHGLTDLEIFIWDHNKERLLERALETIDADTDRMITGMAFHWYSGDHFEALQMAHEKFSKKKAAVFGRMCRIQQICCKRPIGGRQDVRTRHHRGFKPWCLRFYRLVHSVK